MMPPFLLRAILAAAGAAAVTSCSATIHSTPSEVYLLTKDGVTIGVFTSQQAANDKEASFSADDQKDMQITPMEIDG